MSACPKCGVQIPNAFGIIPCPNCQSVLIADFDGNLSFHEDSEDNFSEKKETNTSTEVSANFKPTTESFEDFDAHEKKIDMKPKVLNSDDEMILKASEDFLENPANEENFLAIESIDTNINQIKTIESEENFDFGDSLVSQNLENPELQSLQFDEKHNPHMIDSEKSEVAVDLVSKDSFIENLKSNQIILDLKSLKVPQKKIQEQTSQAAITDILQFGESEDSKLLEGEFLYNITITDLNDIEPELNKIFDVEFNWIPKDSIQKTYDTWTIKKLNPVKASAIVNRLKELSLSIEWEQISLI